MFADRMTQLIAVVLDRAAEPVTRELLRLGAMHMVRVTEVVSEHASELHAVTQPVSAAAVAEARRRVESLLAILGVRPAETLTLDVDRLRPLDLEAANKTLERISSAVRGVRERQRALQQEVLRLEEIGRQLELFRDIASGMRAGSRFSFLSIRTGSVGADRLEALAAELRGWPSVQITVGREEDRVQTLLLALKRDEEAIASVLERHGWIEGELAPEGKDLKRQALEELSVRLAGLRREQAACEEEVKGLLAAERPTLEALWSDLRLTELHHRIQAYFSATARTVLFSGWIPAAMRERVEAAIRRASGGVCLLEWHDPRPEEATSVPVRLRNPRFLAPFQMLVQNYATPAYGTVDPTPFVAVTYLAMFGLMFGDVGQGAVLALVGALGALWYRGSSEAAKNLLRLIFYCGLAAAAAGLLFGSTFGFRWPKALWFEYDAIVAGERPEGGYVRDIYDVLAMTLYFGIGVISLGLVLNWVNLVAARRWSDLVLSKGGLIGGWMYGAGVYTAIAFAHSGFKQLPAPDVLFWMFGVPALLLAAGPLVRHIQSGGHGRPLGLLTLIDLGMEWLVELLEIGSGYLANTLSFMRVAGLGIAHASLMIAFFEIARLVGSEGRYGPWSWLVLAFGNVLVILLEGLSAGIQSLRLNYYEFFSKYFSGSGTAYMPVSLRSRD